jgi:hypothetical protein
MENIEISETQYRGLRMQMQKHQDGWALNVFEGSETKPVIAHTLLTHNEDDARAEAKRLTDDYADSR